MTVSGRLTTLSIQLRLNPPTVTTSAPQTPCLANGNNICVNRTPPELTISNNGGSGSHTGSIVGSDTPPSTDGADSDIANVFSYEQVEQEPDMYCAVTPMSCGKCAVGCIGFNDALIVCGGYDRVECLKTAECYIPNTNNWLNLPNMRENRGRFQIAMLNDVIYALGGSNGHTELSSMEKLDLNMHPLKWCKSTPMPIARSNHGNTFHLPKSTRH